MEPPLDMTTSKNSLAANPQFWGNTPLLLLADKELMFGQVLVDSIVVQRCPVVKLTELSSMRGLTK